jgi:hypothetical protein
MAAQRAGSSTVAAAAAVRFEDPVETPYCVSRTLLKPPNALY